MRHDSKVGSYRTDEAPRSEMGFPLGELRIEMLILASACLVSYVWYRYLGADTQSSEHIS